MGIREGISPHSNSQLERILSAKNAHWTRKKLCGSFVNPRWFD